jgi:hypothetical protein
MYMIRLTYANSRLRESGTLDSQKYHFFIYRKHALMDAQLVA